MDNLPSTLIVIPARLEATRLPGKPLADIGGVPMIVRVMQQALKADIGPVVIAAGSPLIKEAVEKYGGRAILTDPALPKGTDRVFAALNEVENKDDYKYVVNIQGDMPFVDPSSVKIALNCLIQCKADMATLAVSKEDPEAFHNPNVVKIAASAQGAYYRAHYFSRAPIPHGEGSFFHHLGIYAFTRPALETFVQLPLSPLEQRESLEQLRALEHGMTITFAEVSQEALSVDTPEDLERARALVTR